MGEECRSEWRMRSISNKEKRIWVEYFKNSMGRCIRKHGILGWGQTEGGHQPLCKSSAI